MRPKEETEEATINLLEAVSRFDTEGAREALEAGADANARERPRGELGRMTLLHMVACDGSARMVRLLLDYGANPNARDGHNMTPRDWATLRATRDEEAIRMLEEAEKGTHAAHVIQQRGASTDKEAGIALLQHVVAAQPTDPAAEHKRPEVDENPASQGLYQTGKRQWVATLPPDPDEQNPSR
jgi:hypothetical protein